MPTEVVAVLASRDPDSGPEPHAAGEAADVPATDVGCALAVDAVRAPSIVEGVVAVAVEEAGRCAPARPDPPRLPPLPPRRAGTTGLAAALVVAVVTVVVEGGES